MILYVFAIAVIAVAIVGHVIKGRIARTWLGVLAGSLLAAAAVIRLFDDPIPDEHQLLKVVGLLAALLGGSLVTTAAFAQIDGEHPVEKDSLEAAGDVLRGGAWIGMLERFTIYLTLAAYYPAGIAYLVAIKGLGRYPELRKEERSGATERFIIGTLISALWATVCALTFAFR